MRFITKKRVAAAVAAAVIAGGGMAAYAYFTGGATSGSGQAHTGSTTSWTVAVSLTGGPMYPGLGNDTGTYTITNTGGGNQALTQAPAASLPHDATTGDIFEGGVVTTTHAGCNYAWFTATAGTPTPGINTAVAKNGTVTGSVTVSLNESNTNQNACKGAQPDVSVSAA